jgi:hypothetical protein
VGEEGKLKMPCNYKEYPDNFKWLSRQIISDAGNRCELCYAPNGELIYRDKAWRYPWKVAADIDAEEFHGRKSTKIVLTVHHIDGDKQNSAKQNLIALCQRCHLRLDIGKHMANRRRNKNGAGLFEYKPTFPGGTDCGLLGPED